MTDEQKQHYWAMFYCEAFAQRHRFDFQIALLTTMQGETSDWSTAVQQLKERGHPITWAGATADSMLARMVERWPDKA